MYTFLQDAIKSEWKGCVGFVVDEVLIGQIFAWVFWLSPDNYS